MKIKNCTFVEAINLSTKTLMKDHADVICFGLGLTDPGAIFGTTKGLLESFGPERVFDAPTSENGLTGIAIGSSLAGLRPIVTHQRLDFFLLAMDQLVNAAAKWHFMFGGQFNVPITIRLIIGRGWGQGPTHSQNLQAWFAHIPGLKVVAPSTPNDAANLLIASVEDPNPVIFLEHRWLHNTEGSVDLMNSKYEIGKSRIINYGSDLTIISTGYPTIEAIKAVKSLAYNGISCELIDLLTLNPLDWKTMIASVKKTRRLLVLDPSSKTGSISGEIITEVSDFAFDYLIRKPARLTHPAVPEPTSHALTKDFHITASKIVSKVFDVMEVNNKMKEPISLESKPHDVPGDYFKGPF